MKPIKTDLPFDPIAKHEQIHILFYRETKRFYESMQWNFIIYFCFFAFRDLKSDTFLSKKNFRNILGLSMPSDSSAFHGCQPFG